MKNSKVFKFSTALLLGISIIGTFSGCSSKEPKGEAVNVRVGYFPNITHAQPLVGRDQGTFQKAIGSSRLETI
ncbi:hypothetical protein [Clostridium estertheticum]|uniref:hypothetical protein n=1 Tax=Clostridium estertheticum TaxID=238834 RepID=UPI001C0E2758|nr:hypothetical protein [Clostridium estertheticum]MBU3075157.1 hypothetical protein [Clostridium estertheticum]MBU3165372.1 hypothetical protein [Clostridium estertheticum]